MARAAFALGLSIYAWVLLGIDWFVHRGALPTGTARGMSQFRRAIMGRALLGVGAASVIAAVVLAVMVLRRGGRTRFAASAIVVAAGWVAAAVGAWAAGVA